MSFDSNMKAPTYKHKGVMLDELIKKIAKQNMFHTAMMGDMVYDEVSYQPQSYIKTLPSFDSQQLEHLKAYYKKPIMKEPEAMETKTETEEEEVETFHCGNCAEEFNDEDDAEDCCHLCDNCGEAFSYESDAEECCSYSCPECGDSFSNEHDSLNCCGCTCGCEDEDEDNSTGSMGDSDTAPWVDRGHDFSSTENTDDQDEAIAQWGLKGRPAPTSSAANYYLLEIVTNDLYQATGERANFVTPEVIFNMMHMFGMDSDDLHGHIADMHISAFEDLMLNASIEFVRQIELLDPIFLNYCQMAIGGELRHHKAVGGVVIDPPSRRSASWIAWKDAVEAVGPDIFTDAALLFREFTGGSYGGEKWAIPCEIVNMRMTGQLGPTPFMNRKLFIDRVWTLEHNGGCFLNKINWPNGLNLQPVLDAHASNPENIMFLYSQASKYVQGIFMAYIEMVDEFNPGNHPKFDAEMLSKSFTHCKYCYGNSDYGHHFGCELARNGMLKKNKHQSSLKTKTIEGGVLANGGNGYYPSSVAVKIMDTDPHFDLDGNIINPVMLSSRVIARFYNTDYEYNLYAEAKFDSMSDNINEALSELLIEGIGKDTFKKLARIEIEIVMQTQDGNYASAHDVHYVTDPKAEGIQSIKNYGDIASLLGKQLISL